MADLEPPDMDQCQALIPNGHSFMTLGGRPERVRCEEKPEYLITETSPGDDGECGSMTLCADCMIVLEEQRGVHGLKIEDIEDLPFEVTEVEEWVWCRCCGHIHLKGSEFEDCNSETWEPVYLDSRMLEKHYPDGIS
jgi:hypothetical protein